MVTGATGFLGHHLVEYLRKRHEIWALARKIPSKSLSDVSWVQHDLTLTNFPDSLPDSIDAVIHLAQSDKFRCFPVEAGDVFDVNVNGTFRSLEYARQAGAHTVIYTSTGGLYGSGSRPFREDDPLQGEGGLGFYFATKRAGECLVESYSSCFSTVVLRPFFIYGRGQHESMLMPRLANLIRREEPVMIQGQGGGLRLNPVHVSDVVRTIETALNSIGHHVVNVAGAETTDIRSIADSLSLLLNRSPRFEATDTPPEGHMMGDITRMQELFGGPTVRLEDGLPDLCTDSGRGIASTGEEQ